MEPTKPSHLRSLLGRTLLFGLVLFVVRFAYVFSLPKTLNNFASVSSSAVNNALEFSSGENGIYTSKDWINSVHFYSSVFNDLVSDGFLSPKSRSLCLETPSGQDVFALKEIGVLNSIGVFKKASKPLVVSYKKGLEKGRLVLPFQGGMFDFVFSGGAHFDDVSRPLDLALEIVRTMKPGGVLVVHVKARDEYSFSSFLGLFNSCRLVRSRDLEGYDSSLPNVMKEIVLRKESGGGGGGGGGSGEMCSVPVYKRELVRKAEPLIMEEPLKPWITLKRNIGNIKYLPSMADISFKNRYVYVDVGARSYGSSIGSWFKKQYPKQNRTFSVYAIEADKTFHAEYAAKKGVTLLPYAAWIRNETLSFEINRDPGQDVKEKGRGMGRIQRVKSLSRGSFDGEVDEIEGFDFAEWLKRTVTDKDFVVMKMDVEGTEFELIPRLFKTGAMCLIDEIFLECHYNRWQRCCPGQRSSKYEKTYGQCLELFTSLRNSGVLVHQWW